MGLFDRFKKKKAAKAPAPKVEAKAEAKKVEAPKAETPATPAAKPAAKVAAKPAAKKAPAKKAATKAAAKPADKKYQPQCAALTAGGDQCRNSARAGSKYCGSHKGYQPPSTKNVQAKKDTAPASKKADDTLPGTKGKGDSVQCAALTASGAQCKRSARDGSKYCASHKGYRHASDASKVKKADTKPRHAGAADTKPSVRKSSTCAALTKDGKPCKRTPAGRSKYCASHKGYRA